MTYLTSRHTANKLMAEPKNGNKALMAERFGFQEFVANIQDAAGLLAEGSLTSYAAAFGSLALGCATMLF